MVGCAKMGMHFTACTSEKYFPEEKLVEYCRELAAQTGGSITLDSGSGRGNQGRRCHLYGRLGFHGRTG